MIDKRTIIHKLATKYNFPLERKVTISPKRDVKYEDIVKVMEIVRVLKKEDQINDLKENHLFDQLTFND